MAVVLPLPAAMQVAVGDYFSCALNLQGTIGCWGTNEDGQSTPPAGTFVQVSAGARQACAIARDGHVVCWGVDVDGGQRQPPDGAFRQISVTNDHACGIRQDGTLACWGEQSSNSLSPPAGTFIQISSGEGLDCAIATDQSLVCWDAPFTTPPVGKFASVDVYENSLCALDAGGLPTCWTASGGGGPLSPSPPAVTFARIGVGRGYGCGLKKADGTLTCWGVDSPYTNVGPTPAPSGSFASIAIGVTHHCAVGFDDSITCWGNSMIAGRAPLTEDFVHVAVAGVGGPAYDTGTHGCAQRPDGTLRCWGQEGAGYLEATTPAGSFAQFSVGGFESCGVRADHSALCWGDTQDGKYGPSSDLYTQVSLGPTGGCGIKVDGTTDCGVAYEMSVTETFDQLSQGPNEICGVDAISGGLSCWASVPVIPPSGTFTQVSVGGGFACAVRTTGEIVCWGSNIPGVLSPPAGTFGQVITGGNGAPYACGLTQDGSAICWGDGASERANPPREPFTEIAAAEYYACGISKSRKLWCWGRFACQPM